MGDNWEVDDTGRLIKGYTGAFKQVTGISGTVSTSSTSWNDLPDMTMNVTPKTPILLIIFSGHFDNNTGGEEVRVRLNIDGAAVGETLRRDVSSSGGDDFGLGFQWIASLTPNTTHTIKVQWRVSGGTGRARGNDRILSVMELMLEALT